MTKGTAMINVLIADDHALIREGLKKRRVVSRI